MVRRFCLLMVRRPSYARRHTILREPHAMSNRWRTACGRSSGPQSVRVVLVSRQHLARIRCRRLTFIRYAFETLLEPYEEVPLNWNKWIRQTHRWLSVAFTAGVIVNIVAVGQKKYTVWVGLSALAPLALQLITGWYLFVLPYAAKWRSGPRIEGTGG